MTVSIYSEYASKFSRSPESDGGVFLLDSMYVRNCAVSVNVCMSVFVTLPLGAIINPKMFI